jgi:aspartyl-tRNA(Asn)/glutamyl-tRNA(Gln) amidotransferase subunit B
MADLPYRIVVGLEVHVQLLTRTKLFCGCSTKFGLPPNSATCPVCTGMPGVLPVMNRRAFELGVQAARALHCRIAEFTKWDRKNYFYPDLPKNYQISQYDLPFSQDGWLEIETPAGEKRIGVIRVHLEEDAGKMLHDEQGGGRESLVDLNRAGTPLLEIVTRPDMTSPEEAKTFLEDIRLMLREDGISDCEMQEGSLRCDANVNIHVFQPDGSVAATPIVEVKNLNSFRAVERAIRYEADRQHQEFLSTGQKLGEAPKATAGWDEGRGATVVQRRKEEASDYRYFPEPDLVPVETEKLGTFRIPSIDSGRKVRRFVDTAQQTGAELTWKPGDQPAVVRRQLGQRYGLSAYDVDVLTRQGRGLVAYFEEVAHASGDPKEASNWVTNQVLHTLNEGHLSIEEFPLGPTDIADLIKHRAAGINMQRAREVYQWMFGAASRKKLTTSGGYHVYALHFPPCPLNPAHAGYRSEPTSDDPPHVRVYCLECDATVGDLPFPVPTKPPIEQALAELGLQVVGNEDEVRELVRRAIAANPKAAADYKKGKTKAADAIKGAVMRETKGMAKTEVVHRLVLEELGKL